MTITVSIKNDHYAKTDYIEIDTEDFENEDIRRDRIMELTDRMAQDFITKESLTI